MKYRVQTLARTGGVLYLLLIILGIFAEAFVRGKIIVPGDASATAMHLRSMEPLWRVGIIAEFLAFLCVTVLAAIYFIIFNPVNRVLNVLTAFLRIIAIAIQSVAVLNLATALFPMGNAAYLKAFSPAQLDALASLAIRSHSHGYVLALLFFGVCFLFHGRMIRQCGFLPRILGTLIQLSGICYFSYSLMIFINPAIADRMFAFVILPAFAGELSLCLWLLFKGVDEKKWENIQPNY